MRNSIQKGDIVLHTINMKPLFIVILFFSGLVSNAQFHVKVICNPDNNGQVNPKWLNNYVIEYTSDNWRHFQIIKDQFTYGGYRDDGTDFFISQYENSTFQTMNEAVRYAKYFVSLEFIGRYEAYAYSRHLKLSEQFRIENIRHPIHGGQNKNAQCEEKIIH